MSFVCSFARSRILLRPISELRGDSTRLKDPQMRSACQTVKNSKLDLSGRSTLGDSTTTCSPKTLGAQRRHVGRQIRPAALCHSDCGLSRLHSHNITWPEQLGRRSCCKRNFQCQALESNAQHAQRLAAGQTAFQCSDPDPTIIMSCSLQKGH